jgi:endo-1,4-beta-xylanase
MSLRFSLIPLFLALAADVPGAHAADADRDAVIARERMGTLTIHAAPGARIAVEQIRHEFWFGATLPTGIFTGHNTPEDIAKFQETFLANFNAGVIEGAFKWHEMEPRRGQVNYAIVDDILQWAEAHGIPVRGHCIFWGIPNRVQDWIKALDPDGLRLALQQRGRAIGARYRDRFADYDLNNEMIHANYYEDKLGPAITRQMAQWVKDGDPNARLCVNDYDVATGRRLDDYVKHIRRLLDDGVPLSCIGVQGHLHADSVDFAELERSLDTLAQFHLPIRITEYNFPGQRSKYYTGDHRAVMPPEEERAKADALRQYYRICFSHPAVTGILMWGFWEAADWIPQSSLYKRDWTPTPAAAAYRDLVFKDWWTRWSGAADAQGNVTVRAFYGRHRITVNGKETIVDLKRTEGTRHVDVSGAL